MVDHQLSRIHRDNNSKYRINDLAIYFLNMLLNVLYVQLTCRSVTSDSQIS